MGGSRRLNGAFCGGGDRPVCDRRFRRAGCWVARSCRLFSTLRPGVTFENVAAARVQFPPGVLRTPRGYERPFGGRSGGARRVPECSLPR